MATYITYYTEGPHQIVRCCGIEGTPCTILMRLWMLLIVLIVSYKRQLSMDLLFASTWSDFCTDF